MIPSTTSNAKFRRLVRRLRALIPCKHVSIEMVAVGLLERLWHETCSNAPAGDIGQLANEDIAEGVGWFGDADELIEILTSTGWLDRCSRHRLVVHKWDIYAPKFVKQNNARWGREFAVANQEETPMDAPMDDPTGGSGSSRRSPTASRRSPMDDAAESESESESKSESNKKIARSDASGDRSEPPAPPDGGIVLSIPTNRADRMFDVTQTTIDYLADLFPAVDVVREVKKAAAWCEDNPSKRKTSARMRLFLTRWLEKARGDPSRDHAAATVSDDEIDALWEKAKAKR